MAQEKSIQGNSADDGMDILGLGIMLAKHIRLLVLGPVVGAVVLTMLSFMLPNIYQGTARFMPPAEQSSIAQQLVSQLGALGGLAGGGIATPGAVYVGMLQGREITDRIIQRFELMKRYDLATMYETRLALAWRVGIKLEDTGLILVDVRDRDPEIAAKMANAYVEELQTLIQKMAVNQGMQKRAFFEKRREEAREELVKAESELKTLQQKTGVVLPEAQLQATIQAAAQLRAQIAVKEVEFGAIRAYATAQNPDYRKVMDELSALRRELSRMENSEGYKKGDLLIGTGNLPQDALEYARKLRDVKYYETFTGLLAQQYEMARVDEARDFAVINVVDSAVVPDRRHSPSRVLVLIISYFLLLIILSIWSVLCEIRARYLLDPIRGQKMREFEALLRWRKRP